MNTCRWILMMILLLGSVTVQAQLRLPVTTAPASSVVTTTFSFKNTPVIQTLRPDLYTQHLGFFCRQELKMQRLNIPVIFRLGSAQQCNYLEQKPGFKLMQ